MVKNFVLLIHSNSLRKTFLTGCIPFIVKNDLKIRNFNVFYTQNRDRFREVQEVFVILEEASHIQNLWTVNTEAL